MPYVPPHKRQKRSEVRYKSIVIPYIETRYNNRTSTSYVLVKDAKFNEYTFIVGGCKKNEQATTCALRELKEETRGILGNVSRHALDVGFQFDSKERSAAERKKDAIEGVDVTMRYTVYYLRLDMTKTAFNDIRERFTKMRPKKAENNETSDIVLKTKHELEESNKLWSFMKERVLPRLLED